MSNNIFYSNRHCTLYHGDALTEVHAMPSKSVHCSISSPPYWGLRFYHTELQIWGGQPDCEHEFFIRNYKMHNGRGDEVQKKAKYSEQEAIPDIDVTDGTCIKCGAWKGELGLEPTRELFIDHLMMIYDEVYRVLADDGTCFVNIGDTYASTTKGSGGSGMMGDEVFARLAKRAKFDPNRFELGKLKPKSLSRIPDKFCDAMEQKGWVLRNRIIWFKPNVMPSSVRDRFSSTHEYVLFFVKDPKKYYYKMQYEPYDTSPKELIKYLEQDYTGQATKDYDTAGAQNPSDTKRSIIETMRARAKGMARFGGDKALGYDNRTYTGEPWTPQPFLGRQMRDVWEISTQSYKGQHFAAYPEELVRRCIAAGCPEFICNKCHFRRNIKYDEIRLDTRTPDGGGGNDNGNSNNNNNNSNNNSRPTTLLEYFGGNGKTLPSNDGKVDTDNKQQPKSGSTEDPHADFHKSELSKKRQRIIRIPNGLTDCGCNAGWYPGTILDPFAGSGATCAVALQFGRNVIGVELNRKYLEDAVNIRLREYLNDRLDS